MAKRRSKKGPITYGVVWHHTGRRRANRWAYATEPGTNALRRAKQERRKGKWVYSGKWHYVQKGTRRR